VSTTRVAGVPAVMGYRDFRYGSRCMALSDTSARLVAIALVAEKPGTAQEIQGRLDMRLASAHFGTSAARVALSRASKDGLVRNIGGTYVAEERGIELVERWLLSSAELPPMRDDLLARVALCRPKDMPRLIEVLRNAETACLKNLEKSNRSSRPERIAPSGWRRFIDATVVSAEATWADTRVTWLAELRSGLQEAWEAYQQEHGRLADPADA
jgi:hypothetical protein